MVRGRILGEGNTYICDILFFFFSSTGVLLNLQVVIIYHSKSQKSPSEYIILNLGCADLLCTIGSTISAIYQFIQSKHEFSEPVGNFADSCQRFSFVAITIYSFICVLVITLNRFLAVCRPHVFRDVFTLPRTYTILVFSALFAVVLGKFRLLQKWVENCPPLLISFLFHLIRN